MFPLRVDALLKNQNPTEKQTGARENYLPVYHGIVLIHTMAQMAHFSFPYYFTIPNSEF